MCTTSETHWWEKHILVVYVILGRFVGEMLAWLGHIIIDIPTHSYKFYPTPFL
ncbi:hypothetical protein HYX11_04380 [Candidatus Woesearchaeota archaeon]|nr:hypothetical protein [Candidatus Woesearchaeota archaeon]